jgi:hypothetical protein
MMRQIWRRKEMFALILATFTHQTRERKFPNKKSFTAATCTLDALGPAPTHQILATALRTLRDPGMRRAEDSDWSRPSSWTDDLLLRKSFAFCSDSCARSVIVSFFLRGGLSGWTRLFLLRLSSIEVAVFLGERAGMAVIIANRRAAFERLSFAGLLTALPKPINNSEFGGKTTTREVLKKKMSRRKEVKWIF